MKTLKVFLFVLFFFHASFVFSQWQQVVSGTSGNLVDMCFVSDSIGYVVSDSGVVLKTIDQGNTWSTIADLTGTFTSICHVGRDTIFVGGNKIYRSDDGGNTWRTLTTLAFVISDLEFFNSKNGVYIKPNEYLCSSSQGDVWIPEYEAYSSSDSGLIWQMAFGNLLSFSRFQRTSDSSAFIFGGSYYIMDHCNGFYINTGKKTTDMGMTWTDSTVPGRDALFSSLINDSLGYFIGDDFDGSGSLWKMTGTSFNKVRQFSLPTTELVFINEIDGYLIGGNTISKTTSEGLVWALDTTSSSTLNKLYNDNKKAMFAVGANGIVFKKQIIESLYPDSIYGMTASQTFLQFDTVIVGGSKTKQITIHNDGSVPISINVASTDTFQVSASNSIYSSNITFILAAQRDTLINVRFTPTNTLLYQDTLVTSSDSVSDIYIPVSGIGTNNLIGQLSDSLYVCRDTINVAGDFTINDGGKLVICPGTVVYFRGNYKINVSGTLIADGLLNDSIWFTPENKTVGWRGILFHPTTNLDTSIIRYCTLNYETTSYDFNIECSGRTNILIDHCSIYNSRGGIDCSNSSIIISSNKIFNCNSLNGNGCAIKCFYDGSLIINNEIFNNIGGNGTGIWVLNDPPLYPRIIQNLIFNNTANGDDGGIYIEYSTPYLLNNTICNNRGSSTGGVEYSNTDFYTSMINNIIWNNSGTQLYAPSNLIVGYCDIQGGYAGGTGIINQYPRFVNPTDSIGAMANIGNYDWSLTPTSPCINAGDTAFNNLIPPTDFIGNPRIYMNYRIDMGAYEFQGGPNSINEIGELSTASVFPNPFNNTLNIIMSNSEPSEIILYDISSRKLIQQKFTHSISLSTANLSKGIYIYEVRSKFGVSNGKVVKD